MYIYEIFDYEKAHVRYFFSYIHVSGLVKEVFKVARLGRGKYQQPGLQTIKQISIQTKLYLD
jgi:hypothetical protein